MIKNKLKRFWGKSRIKNKSGFTLVEVIVAIAVILIVTASTLVIIPNSSKVYGDSMARHEARVLADNSLSAFQYATDDNSFRKALNIASKNGFQETEDGTEKRYDASSYMFSYVLKDEENKRLVLCDAEDTAIVELDYNDATNWNTAIDSEKLRPGAFNATIKNLYYDSSTKTNGTITASISGGVGNVIVHLDTVAFVSGNGPTYSLIAGGDLYDALLYYGKDGLFYCNSGDGWLKLTFDSYRRSFSGYPAFKKEKCEDPGDIIKFTSDEVIAKAQTCMDFINEKKNRTCTIEESLSDRYIYSGKNQYSSMRMDTELNSQSLLDIEGKTIITKVFKDKSAYDATVLSLNEREDFVDSPANSYTYSFSETHNEKETRYKDVQVKVGSHKEPVYGNVSHTYTATVSSYTSGSYYSKKTYWKAVIKEGTKTVETLDNKYTSCAAVCGALNTYLSGLDEDYVQSAASYTVSSIKIYTSSRSTKATTVKNATVTAKSGEKTITTVYKYNNKNTTYYYKSSDKSFRVQGSGTTFSSEADRSNTLKTLNTATDYTLTSATFKLSIYEKTGEKTVDDYETRSQPYEVDVPVTTELLATAAYNNNTISTVKADNGEKYEGAGAVNKAYENDAVFADAQHALKNDGATTINKAQISKKQFVSGGTYIFTSNRVFAAININRLSGTVDFNDIIGKTIYSIYLNSEDELNAAEAMLKSGGAYAPLYEQSKSYSFDGSIDEKYKEKDLDEKFLYTLNEGGTKKSIYNITTGKYLKLESKTEYFLGFIPYTVETYSWVDTEYNLGSDYSTARDFLEAGSARLEQFEYVGENAGPLSVVANTRDKSFSVRTNGHEIYKWTFESEEAFDFAISPYQTAYIDDGTGYRCEIGEGENKYVVQISVSFFDKTFSAVVYNYEGRAVYELSYMKG